MLGRAVRRGNLPVIDSGAGVIGINRDLRKFNTPEHTLTWRRRPVDCCLGQRERHPHARGRAVWRPPARAAGGRIADPPPTSLARHSATPDQSTEVFHGSPPDVQDSPGRPLAAEPPLTVRFSRARWRAGGPPYGFQPNPHGDVALPPPTTPRLPRRLHRVASRSASPRRLGACGSGWLNSSPARGCGHAGTAPRPVAHRFRHGGSTVSGAAIEAGKGPALHS